MTEILLCVSTARVYARRSKLLPVHERKGSWRTSSPSRGLMMKLCLTVPRVHSGLVELRAHC